MDMNKAIKALTRRKEHLEKRLSEATTDLSYDKSELSALKFAIYRLKASKEIVNEDANQRSTERCDQGHS